MILITEQGFFTLTQDETGEIITTPVAKSIVGYFADCCMFDQNLTVKQFMNVAAKDEVLMAFLGVYLNEPGLAEFNDEVNKPAVQKVPLDYLEIAKCLDFDKTHFYATMLDCAGWRKDVPEGHSHWYDMAFIPLHDYAHLELRISDVVSAGDRELHGHMTVLEVMEAFYYMIARHGPPALRDKRRQNLEEVIMGVSEAFRKLGGDLAENLEMLNEQVIKIDAKAEVTPEKPPKSKSKATKKTALKSGQTLIEKLKADLKNKK